MNGDRIAFVGGPLRCAGFALAGVAVYEAAHGREVEALDAARAAAEVVLVDASCAACLPVATLEAALASVAPITCIVCNDAPALAVDPVERTRRLLGFES